MAIGALTKIITRGIVAGADNLFDEAKVAEKINDWMEANLEIASKPEYVAGQTTF